MAKKFFVKNVSPIIEKEVFAVDNSTSCVLGFDRYSRKELLGIFEDYNKLPDAKESNFVEELEKFVFSKIKFIKNISVTGYETDEFGEIIENSEFTLEIPDSRTATSEFWSNPLECKDFILSILSESFSWGSEVFITAFNDHINQLVDTGKAKEVKN